MITPEWEQGHQAEQSGEGILSNPFAKKTPHGCDATGISSACVWIDGWVASVVNSTRTENSREIFRDAREENV